ncbi:hypothetical protein KXR53_17820 [Inquilinus limosus]|uniref:hypothetical protein n=1 Tax=Inquilinus limosus TaxID=171674 RepID=UPI003F181F9A
MTAQPPKAAEPAPRRDDQARIDPTFRNGSITAVGIIIGFSLSFLSSWATDSTAWNAVDLAAVIPILAGVVLQLKSLADLLSVSSLRLSNYNRAKAVFLAGLVLAAIGIAIAITLDAIRLAG